MPVLTPREAKGLEFDHVVVVEPALIELRELYVALTPPDEDTRRPARATAAARAPSARRCERLKLAPPAGLLVSVTPTLDTASVNRVREYDVVIVGARVAGASLGILLARQGRSVLLLDREEFPSDTLSTHYVHPFGVDNLARLGVLDDLLAAGFRKLTRVRTHVEDCLFEAPIAPGGSFGLAPRRSVLDSVLQHHAVDAGAELLTRTRAGACSRRTAASPASPRSTPPASDVTAGTARGGR